MNLSMIGNIVGDSFPKHINKLFLDTIKERGNPVYVVVGLDKEAGTVGIKCNDFKEGVLASFYASDVDNELRALADKIMGGDQSLLVKNAENMFGFNLSEIVKSLPVAIYELLAKAAESRGDMVIVGCLRSKETTLLFCPLGADGSIQKEFHRIALGDFLKGLVAALLAGKEDKTLFGEKLKEILPL